MTRPSAAAWALPATVNDSSAEHRHRPPAGRSPATAARARPGQRRRCPRRRRPPWRRPRRPPSALTPSTPSLSAPPTQLIDRGTPQPPPAAVDELHPVLAAAARSAAPDLSGAAVENAVVAAAPLVAAPGVDDPAVIAAGIGATAAAMARLAVPPAATQPVDWSRFGAVVPVLAGSAGAGASVLAAAVTDALQQAGQRVLLVDAADPARSGLAAAAPEEGLHVRQVHPGLHLRYSWRHESLLARMESRFPDHPGDGAAAACVASRPRPGAGDGRRHRSRRLAGRGRPAARRGLLAAPGPAGDAADHGGPPDPAVAAPGRAGSGSPVGAVPRSGRRAARATGRGGRPALAARRRGRSRQPP